MKEILKNLHRYVVWAIVSIVFWGWIFTLITDAPAARKVLLYADLPDLDRAALSAALEADMPETIRFVEARAFMDEYFSSANVAKGDVYIVPEINAETYLPSFTPMDPAAFPDLPRYEADGKVYGLCIYDEAANIRIGEQYLLYEPKVRYYLFFNKDSLHLGAWNESADDAAIRAANRFLTLP